MAKYHPKSLATDGVSLCVSQTMRRDNLSRPRNFGQIFNPPWFNGLDEEAQRVIELNHYPDCRQDARSILSLPDYPPTQPTTMAMVRQFKGAVRA